MTLCLNKLKKAHIKMNNIDWSNEIVVAFLVILI